MSAIFLLQESGFLTRQRRLCSIFTFPQITILVVRPFFEDVSTVYPAILPGEHFWCDAVLVWSIRVRAVKEESHYDRIMAIRTCEMERGGTRDSNNGCRVVAALLI